MHSVLKSEQPLAHMVHAGYTPTHMDEAREKETFDVFLSHNSKDKAAVRRLAQALQRRHLRSWFDIEQLEPGGDWQEALEKGIRASKTAALLVGKDGLGPWQVQEMKAVLQLAAHGDKKLIPVLLPGAPKKPKLPLFVTNRTWLDLRKGLTHEGIDKLIWGITGRRATSEGRSQNTESDATTRERQSKRASKVMVAPTRLRHGTGQLFGRETELGNLDRAWNEPQTHVVTIVAWGGVGKTALVVEWMARMAKDRWRGAERVFDWSFYSQGTSETTTASSDAFIAKALEFFGDSQTAKSAASPWDKGARLAHLVAERKTLLVLDGIEPLQYPPGSLGGRLKDPGLEALLKGLAQYNRGLCLVTTRVPVADLAPFHRTVSPEWLLEHLSGEAGADLLFRVGVKKVGDVEIRADEEELLDAAREVGGHALTLQLLGRYLAKVHGGDVTKRRLVAFQKADAKVQGGHAFRMLGTYEKWLDGAGEEGKKQLAVLRLLGLFDRPADADCLATLRRIPAIEGLTETLIGLDDEDWNYTISNLHECALIAVRADESAIDCHPLVREYFGKQLRDNRPEAWQKAHRRLYEHLLQSADYQPETLAGLQPLFQAVAHGCQAGLHPDVYDKVYINRILRDQLFYSTYTLGAFGQELSAMASFHNLDTEQATRILPKARAARIMRQTGYCLRPLGRMVESVKWIESSLAIHEDLRYWKEAIIDAGLLSAICGHLGKLGDAVAHAERAADYAFKLDDVMAIVDAAALHGYALCQIGKPPAARKAFDEYYKYAGRLDTLEHDRHWYYNKVLVLIRLADFSEDQTELSDIQEQAQTLLKRMDESKHNYGLALASFAVAICLSKRGADGPPKADAGMRAFLDQAISLFHKAGRIDALPRALLLRSWLHRCGKDPAQSWVDVDRAAGISERYGMLPPLCDCHLEYIRLKSMTERPSSLESAVVSTIANLSIREHYKRAVSLVAETGYHRRDGELADAEEATKG